MSLISRASRRSFSRLSVLADRALFGVRPAVRHESRAYVVYVCAGPEGGRFGNGGGVRSSLVGVRGAGSFPVNSGHVRWQSNTSAAKEEAPEETGKPGGADDSRDLIRSEYWGIASKRFTREDGTPWPWNCFRPTDTHATNVDIDMKKHYNPTTLTDKFANVLVQKVLSPMSDAFFQQRWGCHAVMLETVAAIPGMVGGMLLHLRSLRRFEHSGGWIKALLEEAENERMHLMTFMEISQPKWHERALVMVVQGVFFNAYFLLYVLSPQLAHRMAGYLEEVAVQSYTHYLEAIDRGEIENTPAPAIAIDYWRLPKDAKLRDVVIVVRADEAHHRDVQHFAADIRKQGKQLHESPAPIGYQ